nr:hypothetical protein [uncultured Sphingobacterium sp.]
MHPSHDRVDFWNHRNESREYGLEESNLLQECNGMPMLNMKGGRASNTRPSKSISRNEALSTIEQPKF